MRDQDNYLPPRRRSSVWILALLSLVWSSCGGAASDSEEFEAASLSYEEVLAGPLTAPADLPFRKLGLDAKDQALLDYALWLIRQPCVRAEGFSEPPRRLVTSGEERGLGKRYYYTEPEIARVYGYGGGPPTAYGEAQLEYDAAFDAAFEGMSRAENRRVGDMLFKCLRAAERELCIDGDMLTGDSYCRVSLELRGELDGISYSASEASPAVDEAKQRWRDCMDAVGFRYDSVQDASNAGSDLPLADSIEQAVHDMRCKDESRLVDVWASVEAQIQQEMIERDPEYFASIPAERDAVLRRAAAAAAAAPGDR